MTRSSIAGRTYGEYFGRWSLRLDAACRTGLGAAVVWALPARSHEVDKSQAILQQTLAAPPKAA